MKNILILLFALFGTSGLQAQTTHRDAIIKIARKEGRACKLNAAERKLFRKDKDNYSSDFFKPNRRYTSDTSLLKDSVYVKAFRAAARKKELRRRTTLDYVLSVVGALVGFYY